MVSKKKTEGGIKIALDQNVDIEKDQLPVWFSHWTAQLFIHQHKGPSILVLAHVALIVTWKHFVFPFLLGEKIESSYIEKDRCITWHDYLAWITWHGFVNHRLGHFNMLLHCASCCFFNTGME